MKLAIAAVLLGTCGFAAQATPLGDVIKSVSAGSVISAGGAIQAPEVKGRKGSKRVGGSGKSGKGGRYVGGR